jgi:hypothetical protein
MIPSNKTSERVDRKAGAQYVRGLCDQSFPVPFATEHLSPSQFLETHKPQIVLRIPPPQQHPSDFGIDSSRRIKIVPFIAIGQLENTEALVQQLERTSFLAPQI